MLLEIFSDTVCPWCYIGKRRLERALRLRAQPGLTLRWRAFQLNPGLVFAAYFTQGLDIGDADVLSALALEAGMSGALNDRSEKTTTEPASWSNQ